jgi:hypothetical protein
MEVQDGIKFLVEKYSTNAWYDSVGLDKFGRYVVYVTTMNLEVMQTVQQSLEKKQVLISYANSKPENLKNYTTYHDWNRPRPVAPVVVAPAIVVEEEPEEEFIEAINVEELITELDRLERICGSHGLQDIFYEVHDGRNAVTNLGSKFPDVKRDMMELYNHYGFDVIYEELDG